MLRIKYIQTKHTKNIDNYDIDRYIGSNYIYAKNIEELKEKCLNFIIENNGTDKLSLSRYFELNPGDIEEDIDINKPEEYLNYFDCPTISFKEIETIPETINFDMDSFCENNELIENIIDSRIAKNKKVLEIEKKNEIARLEKKLEQLKKK